MTRCYGCMQEYESGNICPHCGYDNTSKPKEMYHMEPGTILVGRYLIGRCVGQGGFGITYIGWDLQLERKVAVKEYFPSDFATRAIHTQKLTIYNGEAGEQFGKGLESFIDEAQRLAKFNGIKGVVDIYDTFIENNTGYIVMELLTGVSIKDMLKANKTIDYPTAKEIVVEMLYILREVHKDNVIHRDIAPDNIFITDSGEFKLLDFGAARYAATSHSKSLSVILKPGYAPEEQYRSHGNQGPWTDIYALSATFYKMITGVTPPESMERRTGDNLIPPSKLGIKMPKNDEIALLNALNVLPENRIQNAQEFLDALGGKRITRKKERNLKADVGGMYKFVIPLAAVSVIILVGFVVAIKTGLIDVTYLKESLKPEMKLPDGYKLVNNVVAMSEKTAVKLLTDKGFNVQYGDAYHTDTIPENTVAAQTPSEGAAKGGSTIMIIVNNGAIKVDVGLITGRIGEDIKADLEELGFYNVEIVEALDNDLPAGVTEKVTQQAIGEKSESLVYDNNEVNISSQIRIYVSNGENYVENTQKTVELPNFSGWTYDATQKKMTELGLVVGSISYEYSASVKKGCVLSQSIAAGTTMQAGSSVDFSISLGATQSVSVPNVIYDKETDAKTKLKNAGFYVSVTYEFNDMFSKGTVCAQTPAGGAKLDQNKTVTITVSQGPKTTQNEKKAAEEAKAREAAEKAAKEAAEKAAAEKAAADKAAKEAAERAAADRAAAEKAAEEKAAKAAAEKAAAEKAAKEAAEAAKQANEKKAAEEKAKQAEAEKAKKAAEEKAKQAEKEAAEAAKQASKKEFILDPNNCNQLPVGSSIQINANKSITDCQSANPRIATVNSSGVITGVADGKTTINVYSNEGDVAVYTVRVSKDAARPAFNVKREETIIYVGSSGSGGVEVKRPNSKVYTVVATSSDPGVVETDGLNVTGKRRGSATITYELVEISTGSVIDTARTHIEVQADYDSD